MKTKNLTIRLLHLPAEIKCHSSFLLPGMQFFPVISIFLYSSMFLFSSCVKPEWNNPFGKDCPQDSWTPSNFNSVVVGNSVKLTWTQDVKLISGFKIVKQVESTSETTIPNLAKDATEYVDNTPVGGKLHTYSITAFAGSNLSKTITSQITPVFSPTLSTPSTSNLTSSSVLLTGSVSSDGGAAVTARGFCLSTSPNPTTSGSKTNDGTGSGSYASQVTGLTAGATYYVRAYAINSQGTAYSDQITFTASLVLSLPTVTTSEATNVTSSSATLGGNIVSDGNAAITERGVCISTSHNPTTANKYPYATTSLGIYASNFSSMSSGTTFYVRAYAINSQGTAYGNEITFTTIVAISMATVTTSAVTDLTATSATLGGVVTADGNATVTERGVCFGTTPNPTTQNKYQNGSGLGSFNFSFTGMTPNTIYYVRAYAVNSQGTAYGNEISFTTSALAMSLATVTTASASNITASSAVLGGNITSDGNATVTEKGICLSNNHNPTTANKYAMGSGLGLFSSNFTGIYPDTTYYARAYAINSQGTAYGNEISFRTVSLPLSLPTVTTAAPTNVTSTAAVLGGNVSSDGNAAVTERGVCIDTNPNPTTALKYPSASIGTGTFSFGFTGFDPNTTYYVRAYAKNSQGTAYGGQVTFKTSP